MVNAYNILKIEKYMTRKDFGVYVLFQKEKQFIIDLGQL